MTYIQILMFVEARKPNILLYFLYVFINFVINKNNESRKTHGEFERYRTMEQRKKYSILLPK